MNALVASVVEAWQDLGSLVDLPIIVAVDCTDHFDGITAVVANGDGAGGGDGAIGFLAGFDLGQLVVVVAVGGAVVLIDLGISVVVVADGLFGD